MMRLKLLNDGGFYGFNDVDFPLYVCGEFNESHDFIPHWRVRIDDLRSQGFKGTVINSDFLAWLPEEVEVLGE